MNELTKNIQKMMVPKAAIIAYKYEDRRNSDTRYFIELRPIGKSGQMGAGIPVTYEFMNTLLESYTEEMSGIPALEADNLVKRTVYPEVPPRVEYNLTETGISLVPIINQLTQWALDNMKPIIAHRKKYDHHTKCQ